MLKHTTVIKTALESKLRELWTASDEERQPFIDALNDLNKETITRNNTKSVQIHGNYGKKFKKFPFEIKTS